MQHPSSVEELGLPVQHPRMAIHLRNHVHDAQSFRIQRHLLPVICAGPSSCQQSTCLVSPAYPVPTTSKKQNGLTLTELDPHATQLLALFPQHRAPDLHVLPPFVRDLRQEHPTGPGRGRERVEADGDFGHMFGDHVFTFLFSCGGSGDSL